MQANVHKGSRVGLKFRAIFNLHVLYYLNGLWCINLSVFVSTLLVVDSAVSFTHQATRPNRNGRCRGGGGKYDRV